MGRFRPVFVYAVVRIPPPIGGPLRCYVRSERYTCRGAREEDSMGSAGARYVGQEDGLGHAEDVDETSRYYIVAMHGTIGGCRGKRIGDARWSLSRKEGKRRSMRDMYSYVISSLIFFSFVSGLGLFF